MPRPSVTIKIANFATAVAVACSMALSPLQSVAQQTTEDGIAGNSTSPSQANVTDLRNGTASIVGACENSINDNMGNSLGCLWDSLVVQLLNESSGPLTAYGQRIFGNRFSFSSEVSSSHISGRSGIRGSIDIVFPFASETADLGSLADNSSLFLQQGLTRWQDDSGNIRHDVRHGLVKRIRIFDEANGGALGFGIFHVRNAEYGHEVLAASADYLGRWGTSSLQYFLPTTEWRRVGRGLEERALESLEFGARLRATTTLDLGATGFRSRASTGRDDWDTGLRLDGEWRPHPYLALSTSHELGRHSPASSFQLRLSIPLGVTRGRSPKWEGLGVAGGAFESSSANLWQPVSGVGKIRTATREPSSSTPEEIGIRFLQNSADSGSVVRLEVELSRPAASDTRLSVRLVPGEGNRPAVAGEDFVDSPVIVTIRKGQRKAEVSFQLIQNDSMRQTRSLGATVVAL